MTPAAWTINNPGGVGTIGLASAQPAAELVPLAPLGVVDAVGREIEPGDFVVFTPSHYGRIHFAKVVAAENVRGGVAITVRSAVIAWDGKAHATTKPGVLTQSERVLVVGREMVPWALQQALDEVVQG